MLVDLSRLPVAEPLRTLGRDRLSGDLVVRSGRVVKTLFFDCGRLVFAASNLKKDRLGEALMELGRISEDEFQRATALMHEEGHRRRFGDALVDAGVLDKDEIGAFVARQVDRIAQSLFRFDEGVADFEERKCTIPMDFMVNLSLHRILLEGIGLLRNPEVVAAGLGDLDRAVEVSDAPPFDFDPEALAPLEREILEAARGGAPLRELVSSEEGPEFPRVRAAYALLASGLLAEVGEELVVVPEMETGTFLLSPSSRGPEPSEPKAVLQEVQEELERSATLDYEEWLKVSATATRAELIHALEEKMDRYHVIASTAGDHRQIQHDVDVIIGRAWNLLRRLQQEQEAAGEATTGRRDDTPLPGTFTYGEDSSIPRGPDVESLADLGFKAPVSSDQLIRDGEAAMAVADYARAVDIYKQLVDRSPDVANFRARLAAAMASYPLTAQKAERQFQEAVRLEPERTDLHYRLGMYYKQMNQKARAISCFQTALKLDPRHAMATKELEALAPGETKGGLRKLFRR